VCHFSSVHPWSDIRVFHKECVSLAAAGMDVTLIAVGENNDEFREHGVQVIAMKNTFRGRRNRATKFAQSVVERAMQLDADIYHFHDPELLRFAGSFSAKGKRIIYDVHEDLPRQIMTKQWIPLWLRRPLSSLVELWENRAARKVSAIVAVTPIIRDRFVPTGNPVTCIFNAPMLSEFNLDIKPDYTAHRLIYIGLISRKRGIIELLQALEHIDGRLHLAGKFEDESLRNQCMQMTAWSKVDYHGVVGRAEIVRLLSESSLGMVTLHPTISYQESYPIKMFEYMGAGLPVLASDFPLWESIVVQEQTGICVDPMDIHLIARIANELLNDPQLAATMGAKGKAYVRERFNWEAEAKKLVEFYHSLS
jgi:glycosyltransferase involved in cell wall biosynthesis